MDLIQTEAVVLHSLAFKEYDRILTLFTPQGLLKLFVKIKKRDYLHFAALTSPLTVARFHYTKGRKDLHRLHEADILCQHVKIRDSFESLSAAASMIQALQTSQWPDKPAPSLYNLFCVFLQHLPEASDPGVLSTAFLLKTLKHEGILQLRLPLKEVWRYAGECYEKSDAPAGSIFFEEEEETQLVEMTVCRSLKELSCLSIPEVTRKKAELLFNQAFSL